MTRADTHSPRVRSSREAPRRRSRSDTGADKHQSVAGEVDGAGGNTADPESRGRGKGLSPALQIPKNRSTGNLGVVVDAPEKARLRFSFDAGSVAADYDSITRSPIMTDHDHGLGLSGLRRIRQPQPQPPLRAPTLPPSNSSSRSTSAGLPRSTSMIMFPHHGGGLDMTMMGPPQQHPLQPPHMSSVPSSPSFTEDLARFPSESLHSFSFANQSEEYMHSRQNVLKRSLEFMKDRMGWAVSSNAAMASAQARVSGDVETQAMLDLLARAQLVGANNIPAVAEHGQQALPAMLSPGPLTGPPTVSGENVFESHFLPRSTSPDPMSPRADGRPGNEEAASSAPQPRAGSAVVTTDSENSSRTPTNESGTTAKTSPPPSRRPSFKRTLTDTSSVSMQQRLIDAMALQQQPPGTGAARITGQALTHPAPDLSQQPMLISPTFSLPGGLTLPSTKAVHGQHGHATRWVPAAQAIFTTEAKPPWTILAANDLACLVFGVTKAEVRKMGILEVVQEERRAWIEKRLLHEEGPDAAAMMEPRAPEDDLPTLTPSTTASSILGGRSGGITAKLLSKPNSRAQTAKSSPGRRAKTVHGGDTMTPVAKPSAAASSTGDDKGGNGPHRGNHHGGNRSRGVILCGDVVPIQKRNGATGSASLWVKEKRVGLIWVLEEIHEDVAYVTMDDDGVVLAVSGDTGPIWGDAELRPGCDIGELIPRVPRQGIDPRTGEVDYHQVTRRRFFTCRNRDRVNNIPATVEQTRGRPELRVSSFPHIAGIVVVDTDLVIKSSNAVFAGALFGHDRPDGMHIDALIPDFARVLRVLVEDDGVSLTDGTVVPEHSFRKASAFLGLRDGRPDVAATFLRPEGLPARHRDGSELKIDVQMRVVKSEKTQPHHEEGGQQQEQFQSRGGGPSSSGSSSTSDSPTPTPAPPAPAPLPPPESEMVYALWITYSRHLHASVANPSAASPQLSGAATPLHQPSPGQTPAHTPLELGPDFGVESPGIGGGSGSGAAGKKQQQQQHHSTASLLTKQLRDAAVHAAARITGHPHAKAESKDRHADAESAHGAGKAGSSRARKSTGGFFGGGGDAGRGAGAGATPVAGTSSTTTVVDASGSAGSGPPPHKKCIDDFVILEDMGQGAYGQVKLARYKAPSDPAAAGKKVVLKYVTKRRILVDTWTRDRRLGTVPLEIHVLDYLRRDGLRHPNIVEMDDFFEDDVNYYIEMVPHGLPGMDLFDYIELRTNMDEDECRSIFVQVARAIQHLHCNAHVVHRDIKDENVILDGEGNIKLIDFGSAAYIKSGPFDVFVGTIDYAAPEVLAGKPYGGREQDVWALGILLYTIIYKENPFYSIDEIMDRDLRVPYTVSEASIDLVRGMLDRDVKKRLDIGGVLAHPWCSQGDGDE